MSLPINIKSILNSKIVEQTCIEYKSDWDPEPIIHTICDFVLNYLIYITCVKH